MTPEAQRIAIAETCGWKSCANINGEGIIGVPPRHEICSENLSMIPWYESDLNAMHEAEKRLNNEALTEYGNWLQEITHWYCVGIVPDHRSDLRSLAMLAHATAAQRAEAFLHTLNLWTS